MTLIETELRAKLEQLAADYADSERRAAGAIRDRTIDRGCSRARLAELARIEAALGSHYTGDLAVDVGALVDADAVGAKGWALVGAIRVALGSRATDDLPADVGALVEELGDALGTCCDWNGLRGKHTADCAHGIALVRAERAEATLAAITRALGPYATGEIAGDVTALRDAYDLLRMELRAAARAERADVVGDREGDRRFRCDACGREAKAAGVCVECSGPVREVVIEERAPGYEREPEDDDVG